MVPVCSWNEGEVAFLTFLVIETQVVFWSPMYFSRLSLFAACAVSLLLHVAHPALCCTAEPPQGCAQVCVTGGTSFSWQKEIWNLIGAAEVLPNVINAAAG